MKTIALLNKKGGCGKTSTVFHVSGSLAADGSRVLLVDTDPQANLTQGLLGPEAARSLPPSKTLAAVLGETGAPTAGLVMPTPVPGVWLLPGHDDVGDVNVTRPEATGPAQYLLRDALAEVAGDYDLCLIDCPPNVQLCSWSALLAADAVVVPLQAEDFGAQGLVSVRRSIERVRARPNPRLRLLGYLVTMFNKSLGVHREYEADLRAVYGPDVFGTVVPLATTFKEAVQARKPVSLYRPRSAAAKATAGLAAEVLARLAAAHAGRGRAA